MNKIALSEQVIQILNKTKVQTLDFTLIGPQHPPYEIHTNLQTEFTENELLDVQKKCLRLGFDLTLSRKAGTATQWILKQVDKRAAKRSEANTFDLSEGIPFNAILDYVTSKINMVDIMSVLVNSIASGEVKTIFKVVPVLQPDVGEINHAQIERLETLGYTCSEIDQHDETYCTVYGW